MGFDPLRVDLNRAPEFLLGLIPLFLRGMHVGHQHVAFDVIRVFLQHLVGQSLGLLDAFVV